MVHIFKKGFTLIELIIALAVMSVILLIAIPNLQVSAEISKDNLCSTHRIDILESYRLFNFTDNTLTLEKFVENSDNYFDKDLKCPSGGTYSVKDDSIYCSIHGKIKDLTEISKFEYDFASGKSSLKDLIDPITNTKLEDWDIVEKDGIKYLSNKNLGENRLFFENDYSQYKIESKLKLSGDILNPDGSTIKSNGYGISFETSTTDKGKDTGYIFQFDSGYGNGEFLFRKRTNGKESSPFVRIDPSKVIDDFNNDYWVDDHDLRMEVTELNDSEKQVKVYIDDIEITSGKDVIIDSLNEEKQGYIGFRTWSKSNILVDSLKYTPID